MKKIYLIKNATDDYKIGYTGKSAKARKKELETSSSSELEVVYEFCTEDEIAPKMERTLHRLLSQYHLHGEWFALPQETVNNFGALCQKTHNNLKMILESSTLDKPF